MVSTKTMKSVKANMHPKPPYVPKVTKSTILVCGTCTIRYIKTRPAQISCLKCHVRALDAKKKKPIR